MLRPISITEEEMGWLEDASEVYEDDKESPETSKIVFYLLKRTLESATRTEKGYTLYPVTSTERTTILDVLSEWRELEVENA